MAYQDAQLRRESADRCTRAADCGRGPQNVTKPTIVHAERSRIRSRESSRQGDAFAAKKRRSTTCTTTPAKLRGQSAGVADS